MARFMVEDPANHGARLLTTDNLAVAIIAAFALATEVGTDMEVRDFADGSLVREVHPDDDPDVNLVEAGVSFR